MRLRLTIVALLGVGLAGCGRGLIPASGIGGTPATPPPLTEDASVSPIKATDIAGTYTIDSVTFDADPAKDAQPPVILTHSLETHTLSENGKPYSIQARLDHADLIIGASGIFTFSYSIVDQKGAPIAVGPFKSGSMSGTLKLEVGKIGFSAGASVGLADEQETMYLFKSDKDTITLTDVEKETPTPHFSIVAATKE